MWGTASRHSSGTPPDGTTWNERLTDHEQCVVLVDEHDREVGLAEKMRAHQGGGMLHRAFSVFVFNDRGELLLQRRSKDKPLFAGCWSNACCSHPGPEAAIEAQARRRLAFEMGIDAPLRDVLTFTYRATDPVSQLTEHELDHVLIGACNDDPTPCAQEVDDWRWVSVKSLLAEIAADGDSFSPWMPVALRKLIERRAVPTPACDSVGEN